VPSKLTIRLSSLLAAGGFQGVKRTPSKL